MRTISLTLDRTGIDESDTRKDREIILEWLKTAFIRRTAQGGGLADHLLWWEVEKAFKEAETRNVDSISFGDALFLYIQALLIDLSVPGTASSFYRQLLNKF